jgi:hypothetical protein
MRYSLKPPERVDSVLGATWVLRREVDGRIEFSGFATKAEAEEFAESQK